MALSSSWIEEGWVQEGFVQSGVTINRKTRVIFIPKSESTLTQLTPTESRVFDVDKFRLSLKSIEEDSNGMSYVDTHLHNPEVIIGGIPYARQVIIINGYTVEFEEGRYAVNFTGANTNIGDVTLLNGVSIRPNNSAGLIGSGDTGDDILAPIWDSSIGITNAYQNGATINISWGHASDRNPVKYNIYISKFNTDVFSDSNLLGRSDGQFYSIESDGIEPFETGNYYVGVRAIDLAGNETDNSNYALVAYDEISQGTLTAQEVWEYGTRSLTEGTGLDETQLHAALNSYDGKAIWGMTPGAVSNAVWKVNLPVTTIPDYDLYPQG